MSEGRPLTWDDMVQSMNELYRNAVPNMDKFNMGEEPKVIKISSADGLEFLNLAEAEEVLRGASLKPNIDGSAVWPLIQKEGIMDDASIGSTPKQGIPTRFNPRDKFDQTYLEHSQNPPFAQLIIKEKGASGPENVVFYGTSGIKWAQNGGMYGFWQTGYDYKRLAFLWWLMQLSIGSAFWSYVLAFFMWVLKPHREVTE